MITNVKSPIVRLGGKFYLTDFLLGHIPKHITYCEPFAGAGHLFFAKELSPCEILNDIDSDLTNFFRVIQDTSKRQMLIDTLNLMPYGREQWQEVRDRVRNADKGVALTDTLRGEEKIFSSETTSTSSTSVTPRSQKRELIKSKLRECPELSDRRIARMLGVGKTYVSNIRKRLECNGDVATVDTSLDTLGRKQQRRRSRTGDVKRAADWFYLNRSCFGGDMYRGGLATPSVTGRNTVQSFRNAVGSLNDTAQRLRQVCIESLDYAECIRKYDSPDTLFFCDPPYLDAEHYYSQGNFALDDHHRLSDLLHGVKGKAMVTHYQNALYDELYPSWRRYEYESFKGSHKAGQGATKPETIEVLYTNFTPELKTRSLFDAAQQL